MNAMLADLQARDPRPSLQTSRQSQTVETYTERFEAVATARRGSGNLRKTNSSWARRWWAPVGQVLSHPEKPTRRGHTTDRLRYGEQFGRPPRRMRRTQTTTRTSLRKALGRRNCIRQTGRAPRLLTTP